MTAYYNEIDPYAAEWLRKLIAAGHIAPGDVDTRSIEDVRPDDLRGYMQCHFFAGIGVWSYALRAAGWPDDRPIWTGSCPCQPFSAAGKGLAFADERHLWPAFHHLIAECRPPAVFGEQVASAAVDDWIDLVHADLEALGYAFGSVPFPSAGVGAPHIRDRNYWVADAGSAGLEKRERIARVPGGSAGRGSRQAPVGAGVCDAGGLGNADGEPTRRHTGSAHAAQVGHGAKGGDDHGPGHAGLGVAGGLADTARSGRREERANDGGRGIGNRQEGLSAGFIDGSGDRRPGPTNGYWRAADWLGCTDGKWRPVEPGTFPLAHGSAGRVGRLRAYGNAINAEAARVFIECVMEC